MRLGNILKWAGIIGAVILLTIDLYTSITGFQKILPPLKTGPAADILPYAVAFVCLGFNAMAPHFLKRIFDEGFGSMNAIVIALCWGACYFFDCFSSLVTLLDTYVGLANFEFYTIYNALRQLSFLAMILFLLTALLLAASPFILQRFLEIEK